MADASTTDRPLPLGAIRVLELGDTIAAAYAGRVLADLGADVVKVELPSGDPLRHLGPFVGGVDDPEASASFGYYHCGKRSVVAAPGDALLEQLASRADIVVRCPSSGRDWLDDDALTRAEAVNPGLVAVDISTRGRPSGDRRMNDLLALAASGLLSVNGAPGPLRFRGELAAVHAAAAAALSAIGALHARLADGRGQRIDVSAQAAVATVLATALTQWTFAGSLPERNSSSSIAPWGFYDCCDGMVLIQVTEDAQWVNLRRVLGDPAWAREPELETNTDRVERAATIDERMAPALAAMTQEALLDACAREGVAAARVHTSADLLAWPHLRARAYLAPIVFDTATGRREILAPSAPWRFDGVARPTVRCAPRLGADTAHALDAWSLPASPPPAAVAGGSPPEPLDGVRVADLTWVWAGPYGATQFAHLGADVVKLESTSRTDVTRILGPYADDVPGLNRSGYFNQFNQGKRSVAVDLKQPAGRDLLRRVVATASLVIENMRPGALGRMGLTPAELHALNPSIVSVSLSGFGEDGPERDRMAYGAIIDALSGAAAANGHVGAGPTFFPMSMPDPCAGIHAALAGAAALYATRRGAPGGHVEVSMTEAAIAAFPWPALIEAADAGPVVNVGNRDHVMSPHGTFRCAGGDRWVALAVGDDDEFAALREVIGDPALADDRFATPASRKVHEDDLEAIIGRWTVGRDRDEVATVLRDAGVGVEPVLDVSEVARDPVLEARGFMSRCEHPEVGVRAVPGPAWLPSRASMRARAAAPCLGQHTHAVLTDVLGLTSAEIAELEENGVLR